MDFLKIAKAIKIPFITAVLLGILPVAVSPLAYDTMGNVGSIPNIGIMENAMLILGAVWILQFFGGIAIEIWAGYKAAKAVNGGPIEGGVAGIVLVVASTTATAILSFLFYLASVVFLGGSNTLNSFGVGIDGITSILSIYLIAGLVYFVIIVVWSAIWGFLFGALGGFVVQRKRPASGQSSSAQGIKTRTATTNETQSKIIAAVIASVFLVVVLIVSAIFFLGFLIMPTYSSNVICNSSDPAKIMVRGSSIDEETLLGEPDFGQIKITNLTGGNIENVTCVGKEPTGAFAGNDNKSLNCPSAIESGAEIELTPDALAEIGRYSSNNTIVIEYTDYASLKRSATITCNGPITIG